MFRCENCGIVPERKQQANQHENKFIVKTRPKTYKNVKKTFKNGKKVRNIFETEGFEIVKEISVCYECFNKLSAGEIIYGNKKRNGKRDKRIEVGNKTIKKRRKNI